MNIMTKIGHSVIDYFDLNKKGKETNLPEREMPGRIAELEQEIKKIDDKRIGFGLARHVINYFDLNYRSLTSEYNEYQRRLKEANTLQTY